MSSENPKISVVIPVKNGAHWLDACIHGIMSQTLLSQTEIIVIDSGSTDGSLELLKKYPVRIVSIAPEEFNHGLTRNYGAQISRGEFVVLTVQDAVAADNRWLQNLLEGFLAAENVAAVCGSQVVPHHPDKNPVDWFRPFGKEEKKVCRFATANDFDALGAAEKKAVCGWDDVTSMYKRSVLIDLPFQKTSCSEDIIWAREALRAGLTLVYNPAAKVHHYHYGDREFAFRRTLTVMHTRYKQFGFRYSRPTQNLRQVLSMIKTISFSEPLTLKQKWNWFRYNREQLRGEQKAYDIFTAALAESEEKLDAVHEKFCGRPQMHQKAKQNDKKKQIV